MLKNDSPLSNSSRSLPLVPELFSMFQAAFCEAHDRAEFIVTLSRNNLHRNFKTILRNVSLVEWPDLFQTLRHSCETDFANKHPQHAVSTWMGHSLQVSESHYLQITDDVYDAATADDESVAERRGTLSHGFANDVKPGVRPEQRETRAQKKTRRLPAVAPECGLFQPASRVDRGRIELPTPGFSVLCSTN